VTPALTFPPELLLKAQGIRAAIFDVDGVLTDGRIYIGEHGEEFKAFSTLDGHGLKLLARAGIEPLIVSGRGAPALSLPPFSPPPALRRRVADLGLVHAVYGVEDKLAAAGLLLSRLKLPWSQIAAMGDDWPDLPLLTRAAFSCAPPGAHVEVRTACSHVTSAAAGRGAAREYCDVLLVAAGKYRELLHDHLLTLDGGAPGQE
jgi:3-deoxy-D-manno-octulosonate 8-phosphate phosphatase (KDO 8-P phosphatase)